MSKIVIYRMYFRPEGEARSLPLKPVSAVKNDNNITPVVLDVLTRYTFYSIFFFWNAFFRSVSIVFWTPEIF